MATCKSSSCLRCSQVCASACTSVQLKYVLVARTWKDLTRDFGAVRERHFTGVCEFRAANDKAQATGGGQRQGTNSNPDCKQRVTPPTTEPNKTCVKGDIPVLPRLPLQEERNLATRLPHKALRREPEPEPEAEAEPSLPSASAASLSLAAIMKPLNSLPLDPLLLEYPAATYNPLSLPQTCKASMHL